VWLTLTAAYFAYQITKVVGSFGVVAHRRRFLRLRDPEHHFCLDDRLLPARPAAALFAQFNAVQICRAS